MATLGACFGTLKNIWTNSHCSAVSRVITLVPRSAPSWIFVCVVRLSFRAEGNASGCDRVVTTVFSYAKRRSLYQYLTQNMNIEQRTDMIQALDAHTARIRHTPPFQGDSEESHTSDKRGESLATPLNILDLHQQIIDLAYFMCFHVVESLRSYWARIRQAPTSQIPPEST